MSTKLVLRLIADARENGRKVEHLRCSLLADATRRALECHDAGVFVSEDVWTAMARGLRVYDASRELVIDPELVDE